MKKILFTFLFTTLSILIFAQTWQTKLDSRLQVNLQATATFDVLILLNQQADVSTAHFIKDKAKKGTFVFQQLQTTTATQNNVLQYLHTENIPFQSFWVVNAVWANPNRTQLEYLANLTEVAQIVENSNYEMENPIELSKRELENFAKDPTIEWGIQNIQADEVWAMGYTGQGVIVGGQDTGYDWEHFGIKSKYRGWNGTEADHNYNWHDAIRAYSDLHNSQMNDCGLDVNVPCDDHNHGTHTIGTVVGETEDSKFGVAPDAQWIGCRNMERGYGSLQTYLECFQWFLAPTDLDNLNPNPAKAPHVINNSWGCPTMEGCNTSNFIFLETAVNNLKSAGVVVVASAGNDGSDCETIQNPAAIFENSFTVGAIDQDDTLAWFSSRGLVTIDGSNRLKPNVTAPGIFVRSSIRDDKFATWAGTSMAGPHVVGLVALLISADPTLAGDVDRIEDIIEQTAIPHTLDETCGTASGMVIPNPFYGYGNINALSAVNYLLANPINIGENHLTLYPNPVHDILTIKMPNLIGTAQLQLFAANGAFILEKSYDLSGGNKIRQLSMQHLPKGIYFYRLTNGVHTFRGKVVK